MPHAGSISQISELSKLKRISIDIPEDLHRRAKAAAALRGIELRRYVAEAIAAKLDADARIKKS